MEIRFVRSAVRFATLAAVIGAAALARLFVEAHAAVVIPSGWMEIKPPNAQDRQCGNYATREWHVAIQNHQLQIDRSSDQSDRDPLPFTINVPKNEISEIGDHYERHVIKVNDGYIVGFDNGEWDGSLWWFSPNGAQSKKLAGYSAAAWEAAMAQAHPGFTNFPRAGNVHAIVSVSGTILAFTGLAHLGLNEGDVYLVDHRDNSWRATHLLQLDGEPQAVIATDDSALVLTTKNLWRVFPDGRGLKLHAVDFFGFYPDSVAMADDGSLFLGMRQYVVQLIPDSGSNRERWLAPDDCPTFRGDNIDTCRCVGSARAAAYAFTRQSTDSYPYAMGVGPDGTVWWIEQLADRIGKLDTKGVITEQSIPTEGFSGLAVDGAGNLWFLGKTGNIVRVSSTGQQTSFDVPKYTRFAQLVSQIRAAPTGGVWMADTDQSKLIRLTSDGVFSAYPLPVGESVQVELAPTADGVWLSSMNDDKIEFISSTGVVRFTRSLKPGSGPVAPTVAPDSALWFYEVKAGNVARIISNGQLSEFNVQTREKPQAGVQLSSAGPMGLQVDAQGDAWLTDFHSSSLIRVSPDGKVQRTALTPNSGPTDLAVGPDGSIWFTESQRGRIGRLSPDGSIKEYELPSFPVTTYE